MKMDVQFCSQKSLEPCSLLDTHHTRRKRVANILQDASKQDLKRLLGSFPVTSLKASWPSIKGTKEEICFAAAEERDLPRIVAFMKTNFARCRQHVFVLTPQPDLSVNPESAVPDAELVDVDGAGGKILVTRSVSASSSKIPLKKQ
jgi:ribosome biogenesis protein Tsr3